MRSEKPGDSRCGYPRDVTQFRGRRHELTDREALDIIARKLTELDRRQANCGLPPLTGLSDLERHREVVARVNLALADGPTVDLLAAVGAHLVGWIRAVDSRETVDPASGGEAA